MSQVSCQSDVGNPVSELTFKVFEHGIHKAETDVLNHLLLTKSIELKESTKRYIDRQQGVTENNNSGGEMGWVASREMLISPHLLKNVKGKQLKIECLIHGGPSDELLVELISKYL